MFANAAFERILLRSRVQDLQRLESTLTLPNPGEFRELDHVKKIDVDEGEGLQVAITTMLHADSSTMFNVQHRYLPSVVC